MHVFKEKAERDFLMDEEQREFGGTSSGVPRSVGGRNSGGKSTKKARKRNRGGSEQTNEKIDEGLYAQKKIEAWRTAEIRKSLDEIDVSFPMLGKTEATWKAQQESREKVRTTIRKSQDDLFFRFKSSQKSLPMNGAASAPPSLGGKSDTDLAQHLGLGIKI